MKVTAFIDWCEWALPFSVEARRAYGKPGDPRAQRGYVILGFGPFYVIASTK